LRLQVDHFAKDDPASGWISALRVPFFSFFFFVAASAPYNDIMKDGQLKATTKRLVENCFILEAQLCAEISNWIKLGKRIEFV
jgi:hypothetical protein